MLAYYRDELGVFCSGQEVRAMALNAVASKLERVGNYVAEIPISEKGELTLRIRKLVLP